jgi:hypothetical protein
VLLVSAVLADLFLVLGADLRQLLLVARSYLLQVRKVFLQRLQLALVLFVAGLDVLAVQFGQSLLEVL